MSDLLNKASLVMVPSGYKEDTVFSVVPSDGNGDLTFTRASNGTRVNSAGLVEVCPWNLIRYSEEFDNTAWVKANSTVTANQTTAPNGTTTADKIEISSATNATVQQGVSSDLLISGLPCTFTVYLKSVSGTGKVGIRSGQTGLSSLFNFTNEWQRFTWTFNSAASLEIPQFCNNTLVGGADSAPTFYAWGAQINIGSTAKPYFPTTDRLNVPRLTYQNGGGGCPSLLLEKQSTNLFTYSEQFDNADWTKYSGNTVTANNTTSPDGTQNADKMDSVGGIFVQKTFTANTAYTISVFIKKDTATSFSINYIDQSGPYRGGTITYTFATGSITVTQSANSSVSGEAVNYGNGWIRLILKMTTNVSANYNYQQFDFDGGDGYIWGAQLEASSYATSYIPTTSSSATRVADACYKTGISSLVSASEYTLFWQGSHIATGQYNSFMTVSQTSNENNSARFYRNNSNNEIRAAIFNASNGLILDLGSSVTTTRAKCALRVKNGDFALFVNGAKVNSNTTALAPSSVLDEINLQYFNNTQAFEQNCEMACFFKTALSDTDAIALTTI